MTLNNAYKIYTVLYERKHQQEENENDQLKPLSMDDANEELTYSLLQDSGGMTYGGGQRTIPLQNEIYSMYLIKMEEPSKGLGWNDD